MTSPTAKRSPAQTIESLLEEVARVAATMQREDLAARLMVSRARVARPETVVAVVGEFKRGKSSLVNGLLGDAVCPVDDDIATATLTVLRHGTGPAFAWRKVDGTQVREPVAPEELPGLLSERANHVAGNEVDLVEIQLNNPLLARGIALVDTPGVGGLTAGYSGMTLGYLHVADALLFVTDASAPLTSSELDFLLRAVEACPAVIVALAKTDLYPEWRRILESDTATLLSLGLAIPVIPVSSLLRTIAFGRRDASLNGESGYPELLDAIAARVLDPARSRATTRAVADLALATEQLGSALLTEEQTLVDPASATSQVQRLTAERDRLERLRTGGARWQTVLNDDFGDLVADVDHRFRQAVRQANRDADDAIEASDPADSWETIAGEARERMAEASVRVVRDLEAGTDAIAAKIVEVLQEEDIRLDQALGKATPVEVGNLWNARAPEVRYIADNAATGWASLRGAQGGILVFGMLGSLAGVILTTGAMVGVGALFGGKQLFEERKRQVTVRRQKARTAIRQFLDDVQFEVGKSMRDLSRELQRQLRDHFSERIGEIVRSCATTADTLQKALQQSEGERVRRLGEVRRDIEVLADVQRRTEALARESMS